MVRNSYIVLLSLVLITIVCCNACQAKGLLPHYSLEVITGIPMGFAGPQAINNKGEVLIWTTDRQTKTHHSYLWSAGKVTDLGNLGGKRVQTSLENGEWAMPGAIAYGLNDKGRVVGVSQSADGNDHAFLWEHGKMKDLGTLGGKKSEAWDINNRGQVVGHSETASGNRHSFIWNKENGMSDLGIPGQPNSAYKINESGQVMGLYTGEQKTYLWDNTRISYPEERPLNEFGPFQGLNINNRGDIIGGVNRGGVGSTFESRIFLWSNGKMSPVKTTAKKSCNAFGLTSDRLVVGNAFDTPTGQHAFVWKNGEYSLINNLLTKPGWDVYFAIAVNDQGQIAAVARRTDKGTTSQSVVILKPIKTAQ